MYGHVCWLILLLPLVAPQAPGDGSSFCTEGVDVTGVLLDSNHYSTLLPSPWTTLGDDADNALWAIIDNTGCMQSVGICSPETTSEEDYLITQHVDASMIPQVSVTVDFSAGMCPPSQSCTTNPNFNLLVYYTPAPNSEGSMNISNYDRITGPVVANTSFPISVTNGGFYLAFENAPTCTIIRRVLVEHTLCAEVVHMFAQYSEVATGVTTTGVCVDNAVNSLGSSLEALCPDGSGLFDFTSAGGCECSAGFQAENDQCAECADNFYKNSVGNSSCIGCPVNSMAAGDVPRTECACDPGYARADRTDITTGCLECVPGYYIDGGTCSPCPAMSTSSGGSVTECICDARRATADGSTTTSGLDCNNCQANYFSSECVPCPMGSSRSFMPGNKDTCFCDNNTATAENSPNTTLPGECVGCVNDFFLAMDDSCDPCPTNSMSSNYDDAECRCNPSTVLLSNGGTFTTTEACSGCDSSYYRSGDTCVNCPDKSNRTMSTDDDFSCPCFANYQRRNEDNADEECVPIAGFISTKMVITEGSFEGVDLRLSALSDSDVCVPVVMGMIAGVSRDISINDTNVKIPANSLMGMVYVVIGDNEYSLEGNTTFDLVIRLDSPLFVIGGNVDSGIFYERISIEIEDDDIVEAGFTEDRLTFNESASNPFFMVSRTQPIASDLVLSLSGIIQPLRVLSGEVTLTSDSETVMVPFEIIMDSVGGQGNRDITLQLTYTGPFADSVVIGGEDTHSQLVITIIAPDSTPFSLGAIIGIACAGAGVAVLILMIVVLCLCICRLRVNRQGFYHTYEDKTSEPPTMLRYSASLRSISSQTVMPVTEGKSVTKENEFYV